MGSTLSFPCLPSPVSPSWLNLLEIPVLTSALNKQEGSLMINSKLKITFLKGIFAYIKWLIAHASFAVHNNRSREQSPNISDIGCHLA